MLEILRNLVRRKLRTGLTVSGIVIGIFALTTMGAMAEHFNALLGGGITYYSSNIQVGSDTGGSFGGGVLPIAKVHEVAAVPGVDAAEPRVMVPAKPGGTNVVNFGVPDYVMNSVPARADDPIKVKLASGREIEAGSVGDVVAGSSVAREFKLQPGSRIALPVRPKEAKPDFVQHTYTVVGVYEPTLTAPDAGFFVSLADAQTLLHDQLPDAIRSSVDASTLITSITAYGRPGQNLDALADRITATVPGVRATRPTDLVASFRSGGALFTAITTGAALLAVVIGGLSVVNTMIMSVSERVREIGLKKAVGAHTGQILREYLMEATLIGLIGGVAGFGAGAAAVYAINAATASQNLELFLITPALTILALGFAVALGAVGGVIPAIRAARLDPVTALRAQ